MTARNFTKKPMVFSSFRLPRNDAQLWKAASRREEISQSEFLRRAIREKAEKVLLSVEENGRNNGH